MSDILPDRIYIAFWFMSIMICFVIGVYLGSPDS